MKTIWSKMNSIRIKISLSLFAVVLIFTIVNTYFWFIKTYEEAEHAAIDYAYEMVRLKNENVERIIRESYSLVCLVALDNDNYIKKIFNDDFESEMDYVTTKKNLENSMFSTLNIANNNYSGMLIADLNGKDISFGINSPTEVDYLEPFVEDLILNKKEKVLTPPHHFKDSYRPFTAYIKKNEMVISIIKPILDEREYIGYVSMNIWSDIIVDSFHNNFKYNNNVVMFDEATYSVIYQSVEDDSIEVNRSFLEKTTMIPEDTNDANYISIKGDEYLVVKFVSDFTDWTTLSLMSKEELLLNFNNTKNTALLLSVVFSVSMLCLALVIVSLYTKNIVKLNKEVKQMDISDLELTVDIKSNDEIGSLYLQYQKLLQRIKTLIDDIKEEERTKRLFEIQALQSQINPHFLHNTLNTVDFMANTHGATNIHIVVKSLSNLLYFYMKKDMVFLDLKQEIDCVESYLKIQKYKYKNAFTSRIIIESGLEDCKILKLLIQPIVENCLIHGFKGIMHTGVILIKIFSENDMMVISIKDNGVGMSEEAIQHIFNKGIGSKIGVKNTDRRIKMQFGETYGLNIVSEKNLFTEVELTMPLIRGHA